MISPHPAYYRQRGARSGQPHVIMTLLFMLSYCCTLTQSANVAIRRDAVDASGFEEWIDDADLTTSSLCRYEGTIQMSHPMSVGFTDRYYALGSQMLLAAHMTIDAINMWPRCGLTVGGMNYALSLQTFGDFSSPDQTAEIGSRIVNQTHVMLAGYSSFLSGHLTPIAQANGRLCVTAGSALPSVHEGKDYVFGMLPTSPGYFESAFQVLQTQGAKSVSFLTEPNAVACLGVPAMAEQYGMEVLNGTTIVPSNTSTAMMEQIALSVAHHNPDVVVTCVWTGVGAWMQAMRKINWTPKALVVSVVVGSPELEQDVGTDLSYVMGVSPWNRVLPPIPDEATGWTPEEFATAFEQAAFRSPAYQHTAQSAGISVIVQAIERIGALPWEEDTWTEDIRDLLATEHFSTVYGNVSFDRNGQSAAPYLVMQYDNDLELQLLGDTKESSQSQPGIVYPMPTWAYRDCEAVSACVLSNGTCTVDGLCQCTRGKKAVGEGRTAQCLAPIKRKKRTSKIIGLGLGTGLIAVAVFLLDKYVYRKRQIDDSVWQVETKELNFGVPPEVVGQGSFGLVLLAEYRGTQVAVKRVLPLHALAGKKSGKRTSSVLTSRFGAMTTSGATRSPPSSRAQMKQQFVKEMRALSNLRHPCITTVMGAVVEANEEPMLVMEYMEHGSLYSILHNETMPLEGELLLPMMQDISQGCRFLHAASPPVIHGDLKSANILVDRNFRAKVADFGLCQQGQSKQRAGSLYWMAPELLRADTGNTAASDIYSFGIILFEAFSRKDPYEGEEDPDMVLSQIMDPEINKRPPVPQYCPPQVASLMCDCIVANPAERPTFEEINTRLKRINVEAASRNAQQPRLRGAGASVSIFDIFPRHIAEALRDGKKPDPEHKDLVTIFFSDIIGFTAISSTLKPRKVANLLDRLYQKFDALSEKHDVFKVETIGDAYMCVCNLVKDQCDDHARRIAEFAIDAIQAANSTLVDQEDPSKGNVNIRAGFHSGPVVADVVGSKNPRYCLFGDTVNIASRMESHSEANRIHCSSDSAKILNKQAPMIPLVNRGKIDVKGKGNMQTYWVDEDKSVQDPEGPLEFDDRLKSCDALGSSSEHNTRSSRSKSNSRHKKTDLGSSSEHSCDWKTGGVLRETKARLQLIGDTVNVASRIISGSTAKLLRVAGKRTELVSTKSERSLQPYSVDQRTGNKHSSSARSDASEKRTMSASEQSRSLSKRVQTDQSPNISMLIDWNSTVFEALLEEIAHFRSRRRKEGLKPIDILASRPPDELQFPKYGIVRNEVVETIHMPKFDAKAVLDSETDFEMKVGEAAKEQLKQYVTRIAYMYPGNPFHNFEHASHVMMSAIKLLQRIANRGTKKTEVSTKRSYFDDYTYGISTDPLIKFAVAFSALVHDVDHQGVPNSQLNKERNEVSIVYDDKSPAEQNSFNVAWQILMEEEFHDLRVAIYSTEEELRRFRAIVVNSVMATDIFDRELKGARDARWERAFSTDLTYQTVSPSDNGLLSSTRNGVSNTSNGSPREDEWDRKATIVIEHIIQASDVAHTMQHWHIYQKWNKLLFRECYKAYVLGRSTTDPAEGWFKGELWFFDNYVIPLAKKLQECEVFGVASCDEFLDFARDNREQWASKGKDIVAELKAKYKK